MKPRSKTAADTRLSARGTVPGFLGIAELAKLGGRPLPAHLAPLPPVKERKR